MSTKAAYLAVIVIWSTTPLAIKFSNDSLSPFAAVTLRMIIGLAILLAISILLRTYTLKRDNWKTYFAAGLSLCPNMILIYWSAQYIPSGMLSVIFGLSPFFTGIASVILLKEKPFNGRRILALVLATSGLIIIFENQLQTDSESINGIAGMLLANTLFALSGVWVKKTGEQVPPLEQTTGALIMALPGFIFFWYLLDGEIPRMISLESLYGTLYLAVFGTILGYLCFFYILKNLSIEKVSLITLITPIVAIQLGIYLADEHLSMKQMLGCGLIIFGLGCYEKWSLVPAIKKLAQVSQTHLKRVF